MSIVSRLDMDQSQSCKSVGWNRSAPILLKWIIDSVLSKISDILNKSKLQMNQLTQ